MENACGEIYMLTVLDELTQMCQSLPKGGGSMIMDFQLPSDVYIPASFTSAFSSMMDMMALIIAFLNSNPPYISINRREKNTWLGF